MSLRNEIELARQQAREEITSCADDKDIESARVKFLGRKGVIASLMKQIPSLPPDEKREIGLLLNALKEEIASHFAERSSQLEKEAAQARQAAEQIDITLPGRKPLHGKKHIITQTLEEIIDILAYHGFTVEYGPELETDYYNFGALNFPQDHPARDMQDTFYITDTLLLRTHTSPTQIHTMEKRQPPIRVCMPGKCFRNEAINARSYILFHQIEGLYVDEGVTFGDLKSTLYAFLSSYFGREVSLRFRPSYFPFTEPSAEVDVSCFLCSGKGCSVCKNSGWLELLGAGMVHPNVFKAVGYDPEKYTGFAWGMGIERLIMQKYGIDDIRLFFENDLRFLEQF
ncbi:MAG: phenylalanine--tRNA ligase subunit alpha [bacterium]|nr:phenylalanine--tRNA ligase subunit alpha [bacterium]